MTKAEERLKNYIDTDREILLDTEVYNEEYVMKDIETILNMLEEARKHCKQEISASSIQYERNHIQQHLVYKVAHERVLKILGDNKGE